jgi:hypothetical protein
VAYRLDIVAVEIEHEGTVVVLVIMRTQARLAVVLAAGGDGRPVERVTAAREGAAKATWTCPTPKPPAPPIQKNGLKFAPKPTAAP